MTVRYRFGLPFTFTRDGRTFVCAWHPGHDPSHPDNVGATHGICERCLAVWMEAQR